MFSVTAWHDGIVVNYEYYIGIACSSAAAYLLLWQPGCVTGQLEKSDLLGFCRFAVCLFGLFYGTGKNKTGGSPGAVPRRAFHPWSTTPAACACAATIAHRA